MLAESPGKIFKGRLLSLVKVHIRPCRRYSMPCLRRALLDESGTILYVNTGWRNFAKDNGFVGSGSEVGRIT